MTDRGATLPEGVLDRRLARWLSQDEDTIPNDFIVRAIADARRTRQSRAWRARLGRSMPGTRPALAIGLALTATSAVGLVVVGAGILRATPDASPSPAIVTPAPSPAIVTPAPTLSGVAPTFDPADGYVMDLPTPWLEVDAGIAGARRFQNPSTDTTLVVAFEPVLMDAASVTVCAPVATGSAGCHRATLPTPWMIDHDAQLAWLRQQIEAAVGPCSDACSATYRPSAIGDGDVAGRLDLDLGDRTLRYLFAVRGATPMILGMDEPDAEVGADPTSDRLLDVALTVEFSPDQYLLTMGGSSDSDTFTDPAGRFTVDVPREWSARGVASSSSPGGSRRAFVVEFVAFDRSPGRRTSLAIFVGEPDGNIDLCVVECATGVAHAPEDLDDLVITQPDGSGGLGFTERHLGATLDGEPARAEWVQTRGQISGPPLASALYAVHNGRPYVLTFDQGYSRIVNGLGVQYGNGLGDEALAVIEGFHFLD